jgi:hypothetical protein|tara:strand:- start:328 stop:468 length:141 start_codon:yes stop_codon:yes gene_type:complete
MESPESKNLKIIFDNDQTKDLIKLLSKDIKTENLMKELIKLSKSKK